MFVIREFYFDNSNLAFVFLLGCPSDPFPLQPPPRPFQPPPLHLQALLQLQCTHTRLPLLRLVLAQLGRPLRKPPRWYYPSARERAAPSSPAHLHHPSTRSEHRLSREREYRRNKSIRRAHTRRFTVALAKVKCISCTRSILQHMQSSYCTTTTPTSSAFVPPPSDLLLASAPRLPIHCANPFRRSVHVARRRTRRRKQLGRSKSASATTIARPACAEQPRVQRDVLLLLGRRARARSPTAMGPKPSCRSVRGAACSAGGGRSGSCRAWVDAGRAGGEGTEEGTEETEGVEGVEEEGEELVRD